MFSTHMNNNTREGVQVRLKISFSTVTNCIKFVCVGSIVRRSKVCFALLLYG